MMFVNNSNENSKLYKLIDIQIFTISWRIYFNGRIMIVEVLGLKYIDLLNEFPNILITLLHKKIFG